MQVRESLARDVMRLGVWYPLRWLLTALPPAAGFAVLRCLGDLHAAASSGAREAVRPALATLATTTTAPPPTTATIAAPHEYNETGETDELPDTRVDAVAREFLRIHYMDRLGIFLYPRLDATAARRLIRFDGLERLDAALAQGGAVLVHPHFGPAHVPLVALARLGYPMQQIGLPSDEGLSWIGRHVAFRLRLVYEGKIPADIVRADGLLKPVFNHLRNHGAVMVTGDGVGTGRRLGRHVTLPLFGVPYAFPTGPYTLAAKTGAALLPLIIVPAETGDAAEGRRFHVVIGESLAPSDPEAAARAFAAWLQAHIAARPGWWRFLDRFGPGRLLDAGTSR